MLHPSFNHNNSKYNSINYIYFYIMKYFLCLSIKSCISSIEFRYTPYNFYLLC
ncbi:hypothetical protein HMPREF3233_00222 [Veillonella atypica]|uniref:Uncharacterized protein n=1 Tax=Veillonella atypica TaxID=39777 RepID=A0A133S713_9FIRM|nr:hypothetical protein HMPREF3233_00222 [Veillonella atypica]